MSSQQEASSNLFIILKIIAQLRNPLALCSTSSYINIVGDDYQF